MPCPLPATRHLLRAKDLVDAHYAEPLTVADLARAAGLSPSQFSRECRRAYGETPHQYVVRRRVERAGELLRAGGVIAEVAAAYNAQASRPVHPETVGRAIRAMKLTRKKRPSKPRSKTVQTSKKPDGPSPSR